MKCLIVGCGYVGLPLGAELVRLGHEVSGLRRNASAETELKATGIQPLCYASGGATTTSVSAGRGMPPVGPGLNAVVPGSSGTLVLNWPVAIYGGWGGYGLAEPASQVFTVGAIIYTSDGQAVASSTANFTYTAPTH